MTTRPPAEVGMSLAEVDTPALLVELDAFERNLARMAGAARDAGVRLRPHAKTHKCAVIALRQIELGAVGVCCQKVSEAEALVDAGVPDVLVSNEIVGRAKIARLAALARRARIGVCVDDAGNVEALNAAAAEAGAGLDVLVEINVGANRCGVVPGRAALALARQVVAAPALRFAGLQAYHGRAQHVRSFDERRAAVRNAVGKTKSTLDLLAGAGIACQIVAGAGTGTFRFEAGSGVYNELQAGSYVFMDADYARNLDQDGELVEEFEQSLFVYATVMSKPEARRAVLDAGLKAIAFDSGMPTVPDMESAKYFGPSDEHGNLDLSESNADLALGDRVRLVPGHCDPTVNLHDWLVACRDGRVEALWPVVARGCIW